VEYLDHPVPPAHFDMSAGQTVRHGTETVQLVDVVIEGKLEAPGPPQGD